MSNQAKGEKGIGINCSKNQAKGEFLMSGNVKCIKCNKEATTRFSPDLDIKGVGACEECKEEVKTDLIVASFGNEFEWFQRKYNL